MRILITNDDGMNAPGLVALENAASRLGAEVFVVAPEREQSAQSHAITIRQPVFTHRLPLTHGETLRIAVSGTPCDCVRLAMIKLLDVKPDLVLSGINHGGNLGWNVFHSGTVSAAAEGHAFGVPSIAFSLANWTRDVEWGGLDQLAAGLIKRLLLAKHSRTDWLYNVNIPPVAFDQIRGVRLTRQNPMVKGDNFLEREAPDGRKYYWPVWDEVTAAREQQTDPELDTVAIREGFISITPLRYEVSDLDESRIEEAFHDFKP